MNCCDEYGSCRQGRDCPIRKAKELLKNKDKQPEESSVALAVWGFIVLMLGLMTLRSCL